MWHYGMKRWIIYCLIAVFLLLLYLLRYPLVILLTDGLEHKWRKRDIDNPYVDSDFSDWKDVALYGEDTMKIPEGWMLSDNGDGKYYITDDEGEIWAVGTVFGTDADTFTTYSEFAADFVKAEKGNISLEYYEGYIEMKRSVLYNLVAHPTADTDPHYYIRLRGPERTYGLLLFSDISKVKDDYDIAEAMIYSFAYL